MSLNPIDHIAAGHDLSLEEESIQAPEYSATLDKVVNFIKHSSTLKTLGFILLTAAASITIIAFPPSFVIHSIGISAFSLSFTSLTCFATLTALYVSKNFKEILFETSLIYTKLTPNNWFDEITPNIILGAIPFTDQVDLIKDAGVTAILSMVDSFELQSKQFDVVQSWGQYDVEQLHIETPDFIGVESAKIDQAVDFLEQKIAQGKKVYVHCKAGRGRSASVVAAYLLKHGLGTFGDRDHLIPNSELSVVYAFLKSKRLQVNLNKNQQACINNWNSNRLSR